MAKPKSSSSDKAVRPDEDKLARTQRGLEHEFDPPAVPAAGHRTVTCYNPACRDYRKPRTDGSACACRKAQIGSLT